MYAIICGAPSLEHTISLQNAYTVAKSLDIPCLYIGITKAGVWKYAPTIDTLLVNPSSMNRISINESCKEIFQIGDGKINTIVITRAIVITFGSIGEDGHLQGFLTLNQIPYTGCELTASMSCFNKNICKYVAHANGIPVVPYICIHAASYNQSTLLQQVHHLGHDLIVKINRGGSSIGVFKCTRDTLLHTVAKAFVMDSIVLIERYYPIRELFIGVIETDGVLEYSDIGELVYDNTKRILDCQTKYVSNCKYTTQLNLTSEQLACLYTYTNTLFYALDLNGYARIDFFLYDSKIYINEINTLPAFTFLFTLFKNKYTPANLIQRILNS